MEKTEKTILLVEDEVLLAMDESYTLQDYGYQVIMAHTGEAALEITDSQQTIDLILMDIDLGSGIDGTEAAAKILEKYSIPIIFLSFHQEKEVVAKTEGITSYGYILKSAPETVLIAGIKMAFRLHEAKMREKKKDAALKQIEWMLDPAEEETTENTPQPYGDLLALNSERLILDSVGEETLQSIVKDFLDMLETSSAVYEKNGDYAYGIFSSNWCKFMDAASYRLCQTEDLEAALSSGKWLCHESCWKDASEPAILRGEFVDTQCAGGIHLFAVPIWAGGEVIGAINVGYGEPPRDLATLQTLAEKYNVSLEELKHQAEAYESRPPFIISLAKRRLIAAAKLIGEIVERNLATKEKARIAQEWQNTFDSSNDAIWILDEEQKILRVNKRAERYFGKSSSEMLGKKCHEIVHQTTEPIPPCPFGKTVHSKQREEMELQMQDKYFQVIVDPIIDEKDNFLGAVHTVVDITESKLAEEQLKYQNGLQNILMNISTKYINLDLKDIDAAINSGLGELGEFVEADRVYIFQYNWDEEICKNTYEWCAAEITAQKDNLQQVPFTAMPGWIETHKKGEILYIKNVFDLAESDPIRQILEPQQVKSLITIPIMYDNHCYGFVGFDSVKKHHNYSDKEIKLLKLFAQIIVNIKLRQNTENKLKISENRYRTIFDSTGTVTLLVNDNTYIEMANEEAENVTGFTAEELIGSRWTDHVAPAGLKMMQHYHDQRRIDPQKIPQKYEVDLLHKSGEIRRTLLTIGMIPNSKLSIVTLIDITGRYQATEKVKESAAKMRSIFRAAPIGIGLVLDRNLLEVNDYLSNLLGYNKEELIGKSARILYPTLEDYEYVGREKYRQITENGTGTVETRFQTKKGKILDILLSSTPIASNDLSKGVTFTALDISRQHQDHAALKHSHDLMKYIIEHTRSAVAVHDREMNYIYVSQQYLKEYQVKSEDIIGKNHYEIFPDLPQKWRDVHQRALAGEVVSAEDDPYEREDGSVDWTSWECRPWYENDGAIGGVIVYTEVITKQKAAQAEIKLLAHSLKNINEAVSITDLEDKIIFVNEAFLKTYGYEKDE
ncbi:MAG: PAS domain S-box protein, partial [Candidatus Cloacimonadales bacterium]